MQRLTSRPQFQAVLAGSSVAKTPHFVLHRSSLDPQTIPRPLFPVADTWLGVLLPKRWAKRAVTRNSIRRQIYEVARARGATLPQAAYVVRLRSAFSREAFPSATSDALKHAVRAELETLLLRASGSAAVNAPRQAPHAG
ncbi:MAG: ribonuclease P protein component [Hydrogenophaga sp.]|jgi:ribonuclease P protein component|nr:ribonuclease P protein component [Hydrogenophaga sp.]